MRPRASHRLPLLLCVGAALLLGRVALWPAVPRQTLAQEPPFPTPPPTEPFPTLPSDVPSPAPRTPTHTPTIATPTGSPTRTPTGTLRTPTSSTPRTATATPGEGTPTVGPAAAYAPYAARNRGLGPSLPTIEPALSGRGARGPGLP